MTFLGLRTVIYPAPDLQATKAWFTAVVGHGPYFDEPFYVGFEVGGYELGLSPAMPLEEGPITYWGVDDADAGLAHLVAKGATVHEPVTDVGEGIRVATARSPQGVLVGVIQNPHFKLS